MYPGHPTCRGWAAWWTSNWTWTTLNNQYWEIGNICVSIQYIYIYPWWLQYDANTYVYIYIYIKGQCTTNTTMVWLVPIYVCPCRFPSRPSMDISIINSTVLIVLSINLPGLFLGEACYTGYVTHNSQTWKERLYEHDHPYRPSCSSSARIATPLRIYCLLLHHFKASCHRSVAVSSFQFIHIIHYILWDTLW